MVLSVKWLNRHGIKDVRLSDGLLFFSPMRDTFSVRILLVGYSDRAGSMGQEQHEPPKESLSRDREKE